jgi:hypothetical protein
MADHTRCGCTSDCQHHKNGPCENPAILLPKKALDGSDYISQTDLLLDVCDACLQHVNSKKSVTE